MAVIKPFKALRPKPELARQVAARPYDVLSSEEARVEAKNNPHSFLHITKSEIDLPPGIDVHSGAVYENTDHVTYLASKFSDIQEKFIPFFQKYPLQGYKLSDYEKFCKVGKLMKEKAHLTQEGVEEIINIKKRKK